MSRAYRRLNDSEGAGRLLPPRGTGVYSPGMASNDAPLRLRDRIGLSAYYFFTFAAIGFSTPFLPLYWKALGFRYFHIGILSAVSAGTGALLLLPAGAASDRRQSRHPFVLAGSLMAALIFLAYPHVRRFGVFVPLQAVLGGASTVSVAITSALGVDVFSRAREGRSFAAVRAWGTVGFILTMGVVYLQPAIGEGGRFFPLAAALYAAAALSILLVSRPDTRLAVRQIDAAGARRLLADRNTAAFVLVYLFGYMALMPATGNLSLYLRSLQPAPPPSVVPLAYAISALCELPFLLGMGWAADRFGRILPLRVCFLVLPVRLALYALIPRVPVALLLQATHGLTFSVLAVVPFAFMADVSPRRYKATGQALLNAAGGISNTVGPLVGGRVADAVGIRELYLFLSGVALVGSALLFTRVREPRAPEEDEA